MNRLSYPLAESPVSRIFYFFSQHLGMVCTCLLSCLLAGLPAAACASGTAQFKAFVSTTHGARANFTQSVVANPAASRRFHKARWPFCGPENSVGPTTNPTIS